MKIVFITNSSLANERFAVPIAEFFHAKGHNVTLLCPEFNENYPHFDKIEVPFKRNPHLSDAFFIYRIRQLMRPLSVDLVVSITPKSLFLNWSLPKNKTKVHIYTGQRWATMKNPKRLLFKLIDKFLISSMNKVILDGPGQLLFLSQETFNTTDYEVTSPGSINGTALISKKRFERIVQKRLQSATRLILFLARVRQDKGVDDFLWLAQKYHKQKNLEFVLAGPIDEKRYKNRMDMNFCQYIGKQNNVGKTLEMADLLIVPSYREGFGLIYIEAAAYGVPSLCYDIYGTEGAVLDNVNGLRARLGDRKDLENKFLDLLSSDREKLQRSSHTFASAFKRNEVLSDLYEKIMNP